MRTLYLECNSGISGDMTVAALLDLGADKDKLTKIIDDMELGCTLKFGRAEKNGISAYDFDVIEHGEQEHTHGDQSHAHSDQAHAGGDHTHGGHHHRTLSDILPIIKASALSESAKQRAETMFQIVAEAESKVHGVPVSEVHFHEVGAVDSIVDICAVAFCLDDLKIDRVIACAPSEGTGEIRCMHGIIPIPAPATLQILSSHGIPLSIREDVHGEMVTPTGAAILAGCVSEFKSPSGMAVKKVGYGAGKKDFAHANILRAYLFETALTGGRDEIIVLETNIDDSSPEELGFCLKELFSIGVKDAFFTPIYMKKCRPAYSLTVMCKPDTEADAVKTIFTHTSSVGLRRTVSERVIMEREKTKVETEYGTVAANRFTFGGITKLSLEYDSVEALAREKNVSITKIYKNYTELK